MIGLVTLEHLNCEYTCLMVYSLDSRIRCFSGVHGLEAVQRDLTCVD